MPRRASICYFRAFISPQRHSDRRLTIMSSKSIRAFKIANASARLRRMVAIAPWILAGAASVSQIQKLSG